MTALAMKRGKSVDFHRVLAASHGGLRHNPSAWIEHFTNECFSGNTPGKDSLSSLCAFVPEQNTGFRVMSWLGAAGGSWALQDPPVILVIEDDDAVQGVIEEALTEGGFEPAIAVSGEEAVTLLRGGLTAYRALVTDIHLLGRFDGWEVAKCAREIDPAFPIIYITAGHANLWASRGVPNSVLLTKPFAPSQLVTAVAQLLNHNGTPAT